MTEIRSTLIINTPIIFQNPPLEIERASEIGLLLLSILYVNTRKIKNPNINIAGINNNKELRGKHIPNIKITKYNLLLKDILKDSIKLTSFFVYILKT
jgi:hypothetical protein